MKTKLWTITFVLAVVGVVCAYEQVRLTKEGFVLGTNQPGWGKLSHKEYVFRPTELDIYSGQSSGMTLPWDTSAIGPTIEVRHHLDGVQQNSLRQHKANIKSPVLVRYEIVEAWIDANHATDEIEVPVRSILYWAYSRQGTYQKIGTVHSIVGRANHVEVHGKSGAALEKVVVEVRDYFVFSGVGKERIFGEEGWKLNREKLISTETRQVQDYNEAVAFYDISQSTFENKD